MLLLAILSTLSAPVYAGDFLDTWVTLALEDDNVLAGPEDSSPAANFVIRGNRTFFEDYESRYSDDITQSHLVFYRRDEAFWPGWYTEAAFVIQFTPYLNPDQTDEGADLEDDGSYVRIFKTFNNDEQHTFSVTGYAIDASRFRLGYSYDLSWGGKEMFIGDPGAAPGIRLQYDRHGSYAFMGAKTSIQDEKLMDEEDSFDSRNQTYWGYMAGGGVEIAEKLRLEAGAGYFRQGQFYNLSSTDNEYYGTDIVAVGGAGQVAWRSNKELPFITSSELRLYRNAPDFVKDTYIRHNSLEGTGVLVQAEANYLVHNLMNSDQDGYINEAGLAGDLQTLLVHNTTEIGLDLVYKDLAYIVFEIPGYSSNMSIPDVYEVKPEMYVRLWASHYFPEAHLTPYGGAGLKQPASYKYDGSVMVQRTANDPDAAPDGEEAGNIIGGLGGAQFDISKSTVLVAEITYEFDPNKTHEEQLDSSDDYSRTVTVAADPNEQNQLGFNIMMRARF